MRHGVIFLPEQRWASARQRWVRAEELGFDHAWTYDHLNWRWLREKPWFATVPTLTAAATATSRIQLGTLVASPGNRHPVPFAKEVMTLDDISEGRFICGIGAGAGGFDDEVLGQRPLGPRERADRFAEFVELTDRLLREPVTSYQGTHFTTTSAHLHPGCVQRPRVPIAVAAMGPRGIRLAARYADIWVTIVFPGHGEPYRYDAAVPTFREQSARLDEECALIGRDPASIRRLVVTGARVDGVLESVETYRDACGLFGEAGVTDLVIHWPRPEFPYAGREDVLDDIAASVLSPTVGAR
ncbi:LLM class flavin-dependent oxidoreductase [Streptomyces sp. NPDC044780]|uniref:LLM class flavin-dependent oxidoreductase n=1 Tax=Streptomyces luomodiensis TaxID=3026192 RepID=A0ABY9VAI1_9ACTN|nr:MULTISPECIES: LLM class flavin-dependent oxidoreductase [unclassified Streptomyces]WAP60922.1 LLM class flavin-dependent oxidoreductase [Streptomyces sp. S465]WNF01672.1 LLM class flavin-dependent oxidoreductase [Streptomyces sp. SCA4-21]